MLLFVARWKLSVIQNVCEILLERIVNSAKRAVVKEEDSYAAYCQGMCKPFDATLTYKSWIRSKLLPILPFSSKHCFAMTISDELLINEGMNQIPFALQHVKSEKFS